MTNYSKSSIVSTNFTGGSNISTNFTKESVSSTGYGLGKLFSESALLLTNGDKLLLTNSTDFLGLTE